MKKMLFVLAALALGAGCLMADEAWSEAITLDNASIGTIIQLLPEDEMAYSTKWVEGEDRSAQVTATDASGRFYQIFLTEQDGDEGKFVWNYTDESYTDLSSQEIYVLTHTIFNDSGDLDVKSAQVEILPEPAMAVLALFFFGLLMGRRKALACCVMSFVLAGSLLAADSIVSDVKIASRWPWESKVDIDYTIGGRTNVPCNVAFYGRGDGGEIFALTTVSGDGAEGQVPGAGQYRATWDAGVDDPGAYYGSFKVLVDAESTAQKDNTVDIVFSNETVTVSIADNITDYVSFSAAGADLVVNQSTNVTDKTCGEITYNVTGSSEDGSFTLNGKYKATVNITDLSLTSSTGSPFDIENSKRVNINVEGTNVFVDAKKGKQKACFIVKGHPEIGGSGVLRLTGKKKHAFKSGEYLKLKSKFTGSILVDSAAGDGLHIGQYLEMNNGTVKVEGVEDDGVQVEANLEGDEFDGQCFLMGGTLDISVTSADVKALRCDAAMLISNAVINIDCAASASGSKAIKADGDLTVLLGEINITTECPGLYNAATSNMTSCAAIKTEGNLNIKGGTFKLKSTGSDSKGISADGDIVIDGGEFKITATGESNEGMEAKKQLTINDGKFTVNAYDDCVNAKSNLFINGGTFVGTSKMNDSIDANGKMIISGGTVIACGANPPEKGLDVPEGYDLCFTGGTVISLGGCNCPVTEMAGSQSLVDANLNVSADAEITVKLGEETVATFTVPGTYAPGNGKRGQSEGNAANVLISTPDLVTGTTYTIQCGSTSAEYEASKTFPGYFGE